ncbi:MAG TPA: hypothetical protein VLY23_09740 [Candidatus Acidoferrum sp.]|nr:hypothetical protein [Candidatus Acidoferrum sp.]
MPEVGILIIDDDIASQRALKNILDSEGWRVRIVPLAAHALPELAKGQWDLVIANIALTDIRGPIFAILRELALADPQPGVDDETAANGTQAQPPPEKLPTGSNGDSNGDGGGDANGAPNGNHRKRLRVLYLVPALAAKKVQPVLEREGLPYTLKPYHLHEFLEKVSELLLEAGAIEDPIRSMRDFRGTKKRKVRRANRDARRGAMFASREDYQMTEEEMVEWERQEEEERKKREKEQKNREHLG